MIRKFKAWLTDRMVQWLAKERPPPGTILCDYDRLTFEIRPGDVLLVEGRSRVSNVIKNITQSPWSHAALYIGRLVEISEPDLNAAIRRHYNGDPSEQLVLEAYLGQGTVIRPLKAYRHDNLRICRPRDLSPADARRVIAYALDHLGWDYDLRQLLDLARFLLPYGILPRRWRSSLFEYNAGRPTRTVCSSLLASAFASVKYPIRPIIHRSEDNQVRLYHRNVRLYTPSDFDYSPYFEIIKYPYLGSDELALYRQLPWDENGLVVNDENDVIVSASVSPARAGDRPIPVATAPPEKVADTDESSAVTPPEPAPPAKERPDTESTP